LISGRSNASGLSRTGFGDKRTKRFNAAFNERQGVTATKNLPGYNAKKTSKSYMLAVKGITDLHLADTSFEKWMTE